MRSESTDRWKDYTFYCQYPQSMHTQSLQLCPTLWDPMDCIPPGLSGHGIPQAGILEWVAIPSLKGIFPTQGSNPISCAPALKADSLVLEPPRKPRIHTITVQQHPCDKGANLWPLCNRTEMATFIKLNVKSLNIPCVYICISIYVCMYFVIYTCIIIYTKHVLHAHIFQGVIYLFSQQ